MKEWIEFIRAVGALLWPILAFALFFTYKDEFRSVLRRIRKGKLLGQEIELEESLQRLHDEASRAASEVAQVPALKLANDSDNNLRLEDAADGILRQAAQSPKAALLLLAADLEKELRRLLAGSGWHGGHDIRGLKQGFGILARLEVLPKHVVGSVRLFSEMRNRLIHGRDASDGDILRAIDSGITILRALQAIPRQSNVVHHPSVALYSDPNATTPIVGLNGVILESTSPGGTTKEHHIYPTTRTEFRRGQRVAWEWDLTKRYGEAWYRDPETSQIKLAWADSAEFVGRDLDAV